MTNGYRSQLPRAQRNVRYCLGTPTPAEGR
jgi:hypothetical protein